MEHLLRIRDLLAGWGAPEYVQQSGLLHRVFAPDGSDDPMFTMLDLSYRPLVESIVGPVRPSSIYFYGACDREYTYPRIADPAEQWRDRSPGEVRTPEPSLLRDLMEVTAANEVDVSAIGRSSRPLTVSTSSGSSPPPATCSARPPGSSARTICSDPVPRFFSSATDLAATTAHVRPRVPLVPAQVPSPHGGRPEGVLRGCNGKGPT